MPQLKISIARVTGGIGVNDAVLLSRLGRFFPTYMSDQRPYFKIMIEGNSRDMKTSVNKNYPVVLEGNNGVYKIVEKKGVAADALLGEIDPKNKICRIRISRDVHFSGLMAAIRVCFMYFLEQLNGFFLHASCGAVNNRAIAFTGKSGSGKTTALKNVKSDNIIAEDVLAVRMIRRCPYIFSVPFRNDRNASAKVQAIFFPKKSKKSPKVIQTETSFSVSEVIANALFSAPKQSHLIEPVLESISQFCGKVPAFNLYFAKQTNLRKVIY